MRMAVPKGRLEQPSWRWLMSRGLVSGARIGRSLFWTAHGSYDVAIVRGRDIPQLLREGAVDVAIVGRDVVEEEEGQGLWLGENLGFGRCRLMLAAAEGFDPFGVERLRIATRYPGLTRRWAAAHGRRVDLVSLGGSVEVAPALGLADAVVDIVETGATLRANGLVPFDVLLESYAAFATRAGEERLGVEIYAMPAQGEGMVRAASDA
ncbi:ATP phosphoribosyltransferase catalytic subunit [mine drainage metagenome]|uniref:ATP phosphoribosyltransferase n=1 Tax=mine drainage metagenome TaxID=410659 RepID=T0ZRY0_9ZZZZ